MSNDRRLSRLEGAFSPTIDRGIGSCYQTIRSFLTWWLQPMQLERFEAMYERCRPEWVDQWGERTVDRVLDELIAEGTRVIEGDTLAMPTKNRVGKIGAYVHHLPGVDIESEL